MPSVLDQCALLPNATRRVLVARWLTRPGDSHQAARERYMPFNRLAEEDLARRSDLVELSREPLAEGREAFILISNKAEGCAPESARRLAMELHQGRGG